MPTNRFKCQVSAWKTPKEWKWLSSGAWPARPLAPGAMRVDLGIGSCRRDVQTPFHSCGASDKNRRGLRAVPAYHMYLSATYLLWSNGSQWVKGQGSERPVT